MSVELHKIKLNLYSPKTRNMPTWMKLCRMWIDRIFNQLQFDLDEICYTFPLGQNLQHMEQNIHSAVCMCIISQFILGRKTYV